MSEIVIVFVVVVFVLVVVAYAFTIWMFPRRIPETDWAADIDYRRDEQRYREAGE